MTSDVRGLDEVGRADLDQVGGKGANLAEMCTIGIPVPPGFTITTEVCTYFYANGKQYPASLKGEVDAALKAIRETLDHRLLNEIEELGMPTLENLAQYIFVRARKALPEVVRVKLRRPSYGQTCVYEG